MLPQIAGGDFNDRPGSRLDYLFSRGLDIGSAWVPAVSISDHRPVVATYTVPRGTTTPAGLSSDVAVSGSASLGDANGQKALNGETVLMEDNFDGEADPADWPATVVTGMEDPAHRIGKIRPVLRSGTTSARL